MPCSVELCGFVRNNVATLRVRAGEVLVEPKNDPGVRTEFVTGFTIPRR